MRSDLFHSNKKNLGVVCGVRSDVFTLQITILTNTTNEFNGKKVKPVEKG